MNCFRLSAALCLLALSLLAVVPAPARAGTWSASLAYTENVAGRPPRNGTATGSYTSGGANCNTDSMTITATLTWSPANSNDAPPSQVFLVENAYTNSDKHTSSPAPTASDGFGDPDVQTTNGNYSFANSQGAHYQTYNNSAHASTFTLTSRSLSALNGGLGASSTYSVTVISFQGSSTVNKVPWDFTKPTFFSGTDCKVAGTAVSFTPYGSSYVQSVQLQIGTTVVETYTDTGGHLTSVPISVAFDSTHFGNNTAIPAQMTVTDSGGFTYTTPITGNAYNNGYDLGNDYTYGGSLNYGTTAEGNANTELSAMNYSVTASMTDPKATILSDLPPYTGFYIWTHGNASPSWFGDCFAFPNSSDSNYVFALASDDPTGSQGVTQVVATKTASQPAYNFVFIDACLTAYNSTMAGAFGITSSSVDQAYVGWSTNVDDNSQNAAWSNQYLTELYDGCTVSQAEMCATMVVGEPTNTVTNPQTGQKTVYDATFDILGDTSTRVHEVYGGAGTNWYE
jgi:hypothetical protein